MSAVEAAGVRRRAMSSDRWEQDIARECFLDIIN